MTRLEELERLLSDAIDYHENPWGCRLSWGDLWAEASRLNAGRADA